MNVAEKELVTKLKLLCLEDKLTILAYAKGLLSEREASSSDAPAALTRHA